jgi:hypothetical protein
MHLHVPVCAFLQSGLPVMTGYTVMQSPGTAYEDPLRFESAKVGR